jgi:hypothetical protein
MACTGYGHIEERRGRDKNELFRISSDRISTAKRPTVICDLFWLPVLFQ